MEGMNRSELKLRKPLILIMAVSCGLTVANLYYMQPLLADVAETFHVSLASIGIVAMLPQIGYGLGHILILPIGDIRERRKLIVIMLVCTSVSLLCLFFAVNIVMLAIAASALGFACIIPQLIITYASKLASPEQRGQLIGTMLSGLLTGILLSRTFSGILGEYFGWRAVYIVAAVTMVVLMLILRKSLPVSEPAPDIRYTQLLKSMAGLLRTEPVLRISTLMGFVMFAAFIGFWTTLIFLLESPHFNMGPQEAGLFGLLGVAGALSAPIVGKLADKRGSRFVISVSIFLVLISYVVMFIFGFRIWGLILGVILLDLGHQSCNVCNQARVQSLNPEARSRLNAVYIAGSFLGSALGSFFGPFSFAYFGWYGVCIFGIATQIAAFAIHKFGKL
ncbi:MAG TPA: MFS transporter [Anaerovoracaceae bacterium]|nr:MFS transporter [Anaerovoracaceae bacterium]